MALLACLWIHGMTFWGQLFGSQITLIKETWGCIKNIKYIHALKHKIFFIDVYCILDSEFVWPSV